MELSVTKNFERYREARYREVSLCKHFKRFVKVQTLLRSLIASIISTLSKTRAINSYRRYRVLGY